MIPIKDNNNNNNNKINLPPYYCKCEWIIIGYFE